MVWPNRHVNCFSKSCNPNGWVPSVNLYISLADERTFGTRQGTEQPSYQGHVSSADWPAVRQCNHGREIRTDSQPLYKFLREEGEGSRFPDHRLRALIYCSRFPNLDPSPDLHIQRSNLQEIFRYASALRCSSFPPVLMHFLGVFVLSE